MINSKDPSFLLDKHINELHAYIQAMKVEKSFRINDKNLFDCYSINFLYPGGTITLCDTREPVIQFKTNNND